MTKPSRQDIRVGPAEQEQFCLSKNGLVARGTRVYYRMLTAHVGRNGDEAEATGGEVAWETRAATPARICRRVIEVRVYERKMELPDMLEIPDAESA